MAQFRFLDLPLEIRARIYRAVAIDLGPVPPPSEVREDWDFEEDKPRRLAFRQVSRAVRDEFDAFEPLALRVITQRALHACSRDPQHRRVLSTGQYRALHHGPLPNDGMAAMHHVLNKLRPRIQGNISYSLPKDPTLDDNERRFRKRAFFHAPSGSLPYSGRKDESWRKARSELMLSALSATNNAALLTVYVPHEKLDLSSTKSSFYRIESNRQVPYELVVKRSHEASLTGNKKQIFSPEIDAHFFSHLGICNQLFRLDLANITLTAQQQRGFWKLFDTHTSISDLRICLSSDDDIIGETEQPLAVWKPTREIHRLRRLSITLDDEWGSEEAHIPNTLFAIAAFIRSLTQLEHLSLLHKSTWEDSNPFVPADHVRPLYERACALPSLKELVLSVFFQPKGASRDFAAALSASRIQPLALDLEAGGWDEVCLLEATSRLQQSNQQLNSLFLDGWNHHHHPNKKEKVASSLRPEAMQSQVGSLQTLSTLASEPHEAISSNATQDENLRRLACYESWLSSGVVNCIAPASDASVLESAAERNNDRWQRLLQQYPGRLPGGSAAFAAPRPRW